MTIRPAVSLPDPHDAFFDAPTLRKGPVTAADAERIVLEADRRIDPLRRAPLVTRTAEPAPIPLVQRTPIPEPTISVNATQELDASDVLDVRNAPIVDDDVDAFVSVKPAPSKRALDTMEIRAIDRRALTGLSTIEIVRRRQLGLLVAVSAVGAAVFLVAVALVTARLASPPEGLPHAARPGVHALAGAGVAPSAMPHRVVGSTVVSSSATSSLSVDALPRSTTR